MKFIMPLSLRLEGAENIPLGFQVSDLCFKNQNCLRNPKMGSKQSIIDPHLEFSTPIISDFFQKTVFGTKKSSQKLDVLLISEFFWQHIWIKQPGIKWTSFKKFHFRTFRTS